MTAHTKAAAEVLAAHARCGWNADRDNPAMTCGAALPDAYEGADIHAAHQADELARAGLLADPDALVEWGVRLPDDRGVAVWSEASCRAFVAMSDGTLVRRTVTEWKEAE